MENNMKLGLICVLVVVVILYYTFYQRYSKFNTSPVKVCNGSCEYYNIHNLHKNRKEAAELMNKITANTDILMEHLLQKYIPKQYNPSIDPNKEGRIDVIPIAEAYSGGDVDESNVSSREYMQERVKQLFERYNKGAIYEISPLNKANLTSYTENKGEQLVLCLREKTPKNGENQLHDINTMMFVVGHELTHIMNDEWGHETEFWELFKTVLENATESGVYTPVNYKREPINYCGLELNYSPLFDPTLREARGSEEEQFAIDRPNWDFKSLVI